MVRPSVDQSGEKSVEELVSSVRSNIDVIRDAMKAPATDEAHAMVSDLLLDVKQSQEKLQKRAAELAESGQFESTNEIFETIDQVTHLEPEFAAWSTANAGQPQEDQIGASIHVDPTPASAERKKKKKKKKRETAEVAAVSGGWEAFPAPPDNSSGAVWPTASPVNERVASASHDTPPVVVGEGLVIRDSGLVAQSMHEGGIQNIPEIGSSGPRGSSIGRLTLGMSWDVIGPLLGDPGSSDEDRRRRLGELMKEAIANECNLNPDRICIRSIS